MKKAEYIAKYGEEAWEKQLERKRQYHQTHKEEEAERYKKYYQAHKEEKAEYSKQRYQANKERIAEQQKQYHEAHKTERNAYSRQHYKQYCQTQFGRAANLCGSYEQHDAENNRGKCTLTPEWVIDNIFNAQCAYCGDDDWTHLGADRIHNDLPHTPENCIPACFICNCERNDKYTVEEFKEYRSLHPRELGCTSEVNWEITELPSGLKVIKKK